MVSDRQYCQCIGF
ncbi:hypothetical protein YPPY91_0252, partial [Yersinia pestis PY-91]